MEQWDQIKAVNLRAPFLCAQQAARLMRDAGTGGKIINISSVHATNHAVAMYIQHGQGGLEQLTRCLARSLQKITFS
jgi:NAD(P)-dependent dehydrogenase (short-subunit alcohol dehydrogenase family)